MHRKGLIEQMEQKLVSARKQLRRRQAGNCLIAAFHLAAWVVPILLAAGLALIGIRDRSLDTGPGTAGLLAGLAVGGLASCLLIRCGPVLFKLPDWHRCARHLDAVSNRHSLISIAYDLLSDARESLFARVAIRQGMEKLDAAHHHRLNLARSKIEWRRLFWSGMMTGLLLGLPWMAPMARDLAAVAAPGGLIPATGPVRQAESRLDTPSSKPSRSTTDKRATSAGANGRPAPMPAQRRAVPLTLARSLSLAAGRSRPTPSGDLEENREGSRPGAGVASSLGTGSRNEVAAKSHSGRQSATPPADKVQMEKRESVRASGHPGETPAAESVLSSNYPNIFSQQQSDAEQQEDRHRENKKPRPPTSTGRVSAIGQRQAAPSRQLGMSSKSGGKPGDGRGGSGQVKKSRATATVISGIPITVHVKGKPQPGKSKSTAHASRLGPLEEEPFAPESTSPSEPEDAIARFRVPEQWHDVIVEYYRNLRNSEISP